MGEVIVLLHGGFGRPESWAEVRPWLDERGFDVVTPTSPSWGARRTEPVRSYTAAEMADDVASQVDPAGRPVHLVGYSMGGVLALELALGRRWDLSSLTLLEASPTPVLRLTEHHQEAESHGQACSAFAAAVSTGTPDAASMVFAAKGDPGYWNALPDQAKATLNRFAPAAARDAVMEASRTYDSAELAALDVRTVVACGSNTAPRLRHISEALVRLLARAELVTIPGADHDLLKTHPSDVAAVILRAVHRESA